VRGGKAEERRIVTGRREKDRVEVVEGLKAGEGVVVRPGNLTGGQAVKVLGDGDGGRTPRERGGIGEGVSPPPVR
jgi:multidrug efflux pump subunit AcrA (membrane-fusion protein)